MQGCVYVNKHERADFAPFVFSTGVTEHVPAAFNWTDPSVAGLGWLFRALGYTFTLKQINSTDYPKSIHL